MPKLPVLTSKQLIKKLSKRRAVVPYHLGDLPPGTLHAILKEANISRDELLSK